MHAWSRNHKGFDSSRERKEQVGPLESGYMYVQYFVLHSRGHAGTTTLRSTSYLYMF